MVTSVAGGFSASGISKSFHGNRVLDSLDLEIQPGEVHALLGHNGSGKSTFIKIIAGYHDPDPDSGEIRVGETKLRPGDPDSSADAGITFVHQTLGLIPELTVLENLHLGIPWDANRARKISWKAERARAREQLLKFDLDTSPDAVIADLSTVEQTEIAIVRALSRGTEIRMLVLDEPTAALTDHEVNKLFTTIENIRSRGVAILYVTHRLEEIPKIANRITVLRDGQTVGSGEVAEFPKSRLVSLIAGGAEAAGSGEDQKTDTPSKGNGEGSDLLSFDGLSAGELTDATFTGRSGEVLGVVGLLGSGALDLARVLTARLKKNGGSAYLGGEEISLRKFPRLTKRGVGAVVGERGHRVAMDLTVQENLTLGVLPKYFNGGRLRKRDMAQATQEMIEKYGIRAAGPQVKMSSLSGGNQQKAAIAKVLETDPKVLILEEPCHGVDEQGRQEIRVMLKRAAEGGALVLVVDSDMDEVVGLCSRVLVLREGRVAGEFSGGEITRRHLLDACYGNDERTEVSDGS